MPAITISEFPAAGRPTGIATGADGNIWYTEYDGNKIGVRTPTGVVTEYPVPTFAAQIQSITAGPDGNMWFTEYWGNKIGRITPAGVITEFPVTNYNRPYRITAGADGNLWFIERQGNRFGVMTTAGVLVAEYPNPAGVAEDITLGPDGNVWFTCFTDHKIGRITPAGVITLFPVGSDYNSWSITAGSDGNVWFTHGYNIGKMSPAGVVLREYPITSGSYPDDLTLGPDGNLWYVSSSDNFDGLDHIGTITPAGAITEYLVPTLESGPTVITAGPDGDMWFTQAFVNQLGRVTGLATTGFDLSLDTVEILDDQAIVPGGKIKALLHVSNSGTKAYNGNPTISASLGDVTLEPIKHAIQIGAGKDVIVPVTFKIPALDLGQASAPLSALAVKGNVGPRVTQPTLNAAISPKDQESNPSNNSGQSAPVDFENEFGMVNGHRVPLKVKGAGDKEITFSLTGPGFGRLVPVSATDVDLVFFDTTPKSSAEAKGTAFVLRNITSATPLGTLKMPMADVHGGIVLAGGLEEGLSLHELSGSGSNLTITHGTGKPADLYFTRLQDTKIDAADGIGTFSASEWKRTSPAISNGLTTKFVKNLHMKGLSGDFDAELTILGPAPDDRDTLDTANIEGTVRGNWLVESAGKLTVGKAEKWQLTASAAIGSLTVNGDWDNTGVSGVTLQGATLGKIQVKGEFKGTSIVANEATNDDKELAIRELRIDRVSTLTTLSAAAGGIGGIRTRRWSAPTDITAKWLLAVDVDDNDQNRANAVFTPASVTLTGAKPNIPTLSMLLLHARGAVSGVWNIYGDILGVIIGGDVSWNLHGRVGVGSPGTAAAKIGIDGTMSGQMMLDSIGSLRIGTLTGTIHQTALTKIDALQFERVNGGKITATGLVDKLTVDDSVQNGTFDLIGGAGQIKVGSIGNSTITATENIAVFQVKTPGEVGSPSFYNTKISAQVIGLVKLRDVATTTTGTSFGITANAIHVYVRSVGTKVVRKLVNELQSSGIYDQFAIPNGDFRVTIN